MAKPPPDIGPKPPVAKIHQIIIELEGTRIRVKHPNDAIVTLGMLRLAEHEITSKLAGHVKGNDNDKMIILAKRVPYPPEPKD